MTHPRRASPSARPRGTPALYFAYGSNLHIEQMLDRCPTAVPIRRCTLPNWRLVFRGVADIVPCPKSVVEGALYRVCEADEAALDAYEGISFGLYRRIDLTVPPEDGTAFAYVMNDRRVKAPTGCYYGTIEDGFRQWGIPQDTLRAALESCRDMVIKLV